MSRPLQHPSMADVTVPGILHALSDPVRLAIVDTLMTEERGMNCTETASRIKMPMPKSTCSQHYRILREAGLIWCERKGVELTSCVRARELDGRFPGLLESILQAHRTEAHKKSKMGRGSERTKVPSDGSHRVAR